MGRIRRGWELTKKTWALLGKHRSLLRFPVYGALATLAVVAIVVVPGIYLIDSNDSTVGGVVLIAVGIYLCSFVGFYFSVALAATADQIFHGRDAGIADGLAVARQRLGAIAGWAALSTLVGVIFAVLENTMSRWSGFSPRSPSAPPGSRCGHQTATAMESPSEPCWWASA
jgi:hypothetical protein